MDTPFARIITPAAAGSALALAAPVHWAVGAVCCAVCVALAAAIRDRRVSGLYAWAAIAFFFLALATLRMPAGEMPTGARLEIVAQVGEPPVVRGRWQTTTADVGHYRHSYGDDRKWTATGERIQLMVDTLYTVSMGEQVAVRGWLNPIDTTGSSYGHLMRMRGLHSRMYVVPGNFIRRAPHTSRTPGWWAQRLQAGAVERLSRLGLDSAAMAVATAMTAGDKRAMQPGLRSDYSAVGAAHLLAVSGLHVGIVFVLVNLLLYPLPGLRRGHVVRNIAAIALIWLYAAASGLSPSVVRAALMFSLVQWALATTSPRTTLNIVLGSAVVMMAVNPAWAADASFLMSYTAVLAIIVFFPPLYRRLRTKYRIVNALTSVTLVGVVATLGTAPLVAHLFGNFPLAGVVLNPVVILTAHIIVMTGVVWTVAPIDALNPVFSHIIQTASDIQNGVVGWSARLGWASTEAHLPLWAVLAIYALYIAAAIALDRARERRKPLLGNSYK